MTPSQNHPTTPLPPSISSALRNRGLTTPPQALASPWPPRSGRQEPTGSISWAAAAPSSLKASRPSRRPPPPQHRPLLRRTRPRRLRLPRPRPNRMRRDLPVLHLGRSRADRARERLRRRADQQRGHDRARAHQLQRRADHHRAAGRAAKRLGWVGGHNGHERVVRRWCLRRLPAAAGRREPPLRVGGRQGGRAWPHAAVAAGGVRRGRR